MKDRTLLYYLEANQDTLLPPASMTAPINSKEWFVKLKDHFNDLIWLYYSDRTVFINDRFKLDDTDERTILNIMRSFSINLKTKNYEYENLYNSMVLEFNPLWNVDGVEGIIHEYTNNTTGGDSHSGKDSHSSNHSNDVTRNRGMRDELENDDTMVETSRTTYDSGDTYYPTEKTHTIHGTLNNPKHQITENVKDIDKGNESGTTTYGSRHDTVNNTTHKELEMHIRQGNIGVTKSTELLEDYRQLAMFDFFKLVVRECVNTCTYAVE